MARVRTRTPQQRDARELALTRQADPYRGALKDPFTPTQIVVPERAATAAVRSEAQAEPVDRARFSPAVRSSQPGGATFGAILGLILALGTGVFGLLLVTIVSLQDKYATQDRSYYRGTDSSYVLLGIIDFAIAVLCGLGAIGLLNGRVVGRVALSIGGWACLILAGYWLEDSTVVWFIPVVVALMAAAMLVAVYTRTVTRWLGVLIPPQPE